MIHVIATIDVARGKLSSLLEEFAKIVPKVRAENGCLEYGPTLDVPTKISAQPPVRENTVTVIEKWEDLECLGAHLISPHMVEYRQKVKDLVAGVQLRVLRPAAGE